MKRLVNYPVTVLFFVFLTTFSVVNFLLPASAYSELENRYLAQMPKFSFKSMLDSSERGFARRFEQYVNDQFLLRDDWITIKSVTEAALGKIENNGIVYGKDGYMFEKYRSYDANQLEKNLICIEKFAAGNPGIQKYVMVVPGADSVLSGKVPEGLGNVDQLSGIEKIDSRLLQSGLLPLDVTGALASHANEAIYYRTDHHWTTLGAQYAYRAFSQEAGFSPMIPANATKHIAEGFFGTHFSKAKKFDAIPDSIVWYDLPVDSVTVDGESKDGMYDFTQLDGRDKYAMFLYANNGVTIIENHSAPNRRILVIKDSYANCFVPFLTQNYSTVTVVDLRALPEGLDSLIKREQFDDALILYSFSNLASDTNLLRINY